MYKKDSAPGLQGMAPFPCILLGLTSIEFLAIWQFILKSQDEGSLCKPACDSVAGVLCWQAGDRKLNPITTQLHSYHRAVIVVLSQISCMNIIVWATGPHLQLQLKFLSSEGQKKPGAALCQGVSSWLTLDSFLISTQSIWHLT